MLLENKVAVIYGGGGAIGGAVGSSFAAQGARVFLAGRTRASLHRVVEEIRAAGGEAEAAEVDALDGRSVDEHLEAVVAAAGRVDVSFNLISHGYVQGRPFVEMEVDEYVRPVQTTVRTLFLTARAAARQMLTQGSGVILLFGGEADPPRGPYLGSLQIGFHAAEAMRRQLATELGAGGVRVVTLRTSGIPDSIPAELPGRDAIAESIRRSTLLGRAATLQDVGNAAAFLASDAAGTITGASVNISGGTFLD